MRRTPWLVLLLTALLALPGSRAHAQVRVSAALSSSSIEQGDVVVLTVTVLNPSGNPTAPKFSLPDGVLGEGPSVGRSLSIVNGVSTSSVQYQYRLRADLPGRYSIGPVRLTAGGREYVTRALDLEVRRLSDVPARLYVEVSTREPYAGQLVQVTSRLVQYAPLDDAGDKGPPPMPGFWSERFSDLFELRGRQNGRPVGVVESRARVYPLGPGRATIGRAHVAIAVGAQVVDPFTGQVAGGRQYMLYSDSVVLNVKPLPSGAPAGFGKGVGAFAVSWSLDRGHTTQDQALLLQLDVRGVGNLPLLSTPAVEVRDFEVFASTVDDSFAPPGDLTPGRRRFQWTLLPRRTGQLSVPPIAYAWFDPGAAAWRSAALPTLRVEVIASGAGAATDRAGGFPAELSSNGARPGARAALPWVFVIAGALFGLGVRLVRRASRPDDLAAERGRQREWLRAVGLTRGPDFWRAADDAAAWVESRGGQVLRLRVDISAARFGGQVALEEDVRRRLVERISEALPAAPSGAPQRALGFTLMPVALALLFLGAPQLADEKHAAAARAGDALAREHRPTEAAQAWRNVWRESPGDAALAARLSWAALQSGDAGEGTLWALRGRADEPRNAALAFVERRVREAGGLVGAPAGPLPLRSIEWAALAFALALGALLEWPRRWSAALLAALAILAAFAPPLQRRLANGGALAVVMRSEPLAGAEVDLESGQVVRVIGRSGALVRVKAGRDLTGTVNAAALRELGGGPP